MNGGTCIDGVDNFTCSCPPMLTGPMCECLILEDGSFDCQYVSSTSQPESSQSVFFTTFTTELTSTEMTTTYSGSTYTIPRTSSTATENDTSVTTTLSGESTTTENTETTTDQTQFDRFSTITENKDTTLTTVVTTTIKEEETDTAQTITKETISSEDTRTETTTEYHEFSEKSTLSTIITPTAAPEMTTLYFNDTISTDTISMLTTKETITITDNTTPATAELSSTPKIDVITDKIFTETPTEHVVTDAMLTTISTTDAIDLTTTFDNTTYAITTEESECTDNLCNNHGTCANTLHGIRVSTYIRI